MMIKFNLDPIDSLGDCWNIGRSLFFFLFYPAENLFAQRVYAPQPRGSSLLSDPYRGFTRGGKHWWLGTFIPFIIEIVQERLVE
jgi:hypothetical protein